MRPERKILFMMSGSIACAKATGLISAWRKAGHTVRVAATASVPHFVGAATLEGLSGGPVFGDTFEAGRAMDHIELARWADVVVVCPASASLLARMASGLADDAVSTLWQATWGRGVPQFVVPAMNTHMWEYPATRDNVERLKRWGVHVLPTASGDLACGETGAGRMLEPEDIRQRIESVLTFEEGPGRRSVLITGGGTREPIDAVRFIGNRSTGRTAAALADALQARGFAVTWLGGTGAARPRHAGVRQARYETFDDLSRQLERLLGEQRFAAVVQAAAVSDFSVDRAGALSGAEARKLGSGAAVNLALKPNPKLLKRLRGWSVDRDLCVVGFKLTVNADDAVRDAAVGRLFEGGACDLVVHNDLGDIDERRHPFRVVDASGAGTAVEGADALAALLAEHLGRVPATAGDER